MYEIKSHKLEEIIKRDTKIEKEYHKYVFDEKEMYEKYFHIYLEKKKIRETKEKELEKLKAIEKEKEDEITNIHGEISLAEIQKMYYEHLIRKSYRRLPDDMSLWNTKENQKIIANINKYQEKMNELNLKQDNFRMQIKDIESEIDKNKQNQKYTQKKIDDALYDEKTAHKNALEWENILDMKTERFYKAVMMSVSENFEPCQEVLIRNLEDEKNMTKEEAKEKSSVIILDDEYYLSKNYPKRVRVKKDFGEIYYPNEKDEKKAA